MKTLYFPAEKRYRKSIVSFFGRTVMRAAGVVWVSLWLGLASGLHAEDLGLSVKLGGFTPTSSGDMDFTVTVVNTAERDFCVPTFSDKPKDPEFTGFGDYELNWPRGELTPIDTESQSAAAHDPKLAIFRMRTETQVSFVSSALIEDFFPAPIGAALEVRWVIKGFWCDELDARVAPNPPRLSHISVETGTFHRWPDDTSVVVQSGWRRFIIPHEQ